RGQYDVSDNITLMLPKHKPPERQQPEMVAGNDPLFRQIAFGQESENPPTDRQIGKITKRDGGDHDERHLEVPRAPDPRQHRRSNWLHQRSKRDQDRSAESMR